MYLKRLEIHGFKSFAHKVTLDFDPGMTAVVGPNGSGKSNVADSLRWVMGEQSLKLLRGKKSEDVIFAGSDKKSKLSMAEVALTFDNKDRKMPLEYAEVVITRRLYRNGDSEYLINNQRVRLLDVVDALMRSGFGASNYAVIGQGTIDQMILAGPTEIQNLVEEASGVKPYYLKREKTLRRLEQTEENLQRVSELLQEIEPRLRSLKRQAKRMEERESIASELLGLQLQFYGNQIYLLEADLQNIEEQAAHKRSAVTKIQTELDAFQRTVERDEQQSGQTNTFLEELDRKLKELEARRLAVAEKLAEVKGQLKVELPVAKNFSEFRSRFESILDLLRPENILDIKQKLKDLVSSFGESKNDELQKHKQQLSLELEQVTAEMNEQTRTRHQLLAEEKQKKSFLTQEEKKFRAKSSELSQIKDQLNSLLVEKARIDTRLETLQTESLDALGEKYDHLPLHKKPGLASDIAQRIPKLKHQLELAGGIDESVLKEYRETQERFDYLSSQSQDLAAGVADLKTVTEELDQIIKKQFDEAFNKISEKFSEYFRILFNGGRAQMTMLKAAKEAEEGVEVTDAEEPNMAHIDGVRQSAAAKSYGGSAEALREGRKKSATEIVGIDIKATPPGKKLASIAALSGGERALTAIALLCSMLACYPSPFVVLDEVDAALDEANSIRFAKILGTLAYQTQFITITHNRETMRQAHTLYGVTMTEEGISKILSVKLEQAQKMEARPQ